MFPYSGHIILIPSQPVFPLSPECCVLSREATNTNFIVFCLIRSGLELTIYRTRREHATNYTIDAVYWNIYIPVYKYGFGLTIVQ